MGIIDKFKFYFWLPINKILGILESSSKIKLVKAEMIILTGNFRNENNAELNSYITTTNKDGTFVTRNTTIDLVAASSAFEKQDVEELKGRILNRLNGNQNVIFMDIGASFGKYTIVLGNYFKKFGNRFTILAFEPELFSFDLLKKNVELNKLKNISIYNYALNDKPGRQVFFQDANSKYLTSARIPNSKAKVIKMKKLDTFLKKISKSASLFIKLDVEGHEIPVLKGATMLTRFSRATILMEDCFPETSNKLLRFISGIANFSRKITPYNSFWEIK